MNRLNISILDKQIKPLRLKTCKTCRQSLDIEKDFYAHYKLCDGTIMARGKCKKCECLAKSKKNIEKGSKKARPFCCLNGYRECLSCSRILENECFHLRHGSKKHKRKSKCKECTTRTHVLRLLENGKIPSQELRFCCLRGYKYCPRCNNFLEKSSFNNDKKTQDKLQYHCKACNSKYQRANLKKKREKKRLEPKKPIIIILPTEKVCKRCSVSKPILDFPWRKTRITPDATCKKCRSERSKQYARDKDKQSKTLKIWKQKKKTDPNYKLIENLRHFARKSITYEYNGSKTKYLLGVDILTCRNRLEGLFTSEMSWDNYGKVWVIDHIIPLELFDLTTKECSLICLNFQNLQPSIKSDNLSKSDILPNGIRARNLPKIQTKEQLLDLIQTWPNPQKFDWVKDIEIPYIPDYQI